MVGDNPWCIKLEVFGACFLLKMLWLSSPTAGFYSDSPKHMQNFMKIRPWLGPVAWLQINPFIVETFIPDFLKFIN